MLKPCTRAGWQALWNISRARCEELNKVYPTIVFGTVKKVDFDELQAEFIVSEVDDAGIGNSQTVQLVDLWPTRKQKDAEMNAHAYEIAQCIDFLRYLNPIASTLSQMLIIVIIFVLQILLQQYLDAMGSLSSF